MRNRFDRELDSLNNELIEMGALVENAIENATLALLNRDGERDVYKRQALVVSLTLLATVILSKAIGCTLPLLAKKCKLDPAIMASPLITTIVDASSLMIFFYIATVVDVYKRQP